MALKIFILVSCVALVRAGLIRTIAEPVLTKSEENDPHPQYSFGYDIQDAISGDSKNQFENRDGDVVRGQYSLNDADGFRRIVDYTADSVNGFNAFVRKEPIGVALKAAVPAATVVKAAPAPIAYTAPAPALLKSTTIIQSSGLIQPTAGAIVKTTYTSPLASYAY